MSTSASTLSGGRSPVAAGTFQKVAELSGRILLATLFLMSGLGKIGNYGATAGYMAAVGVPAGLLPITIAMEVVGAVFVIIGWKTRPTAFLLAGFTFLTAVLFHRNLGDQIQLIMFLKNVSITGAFLLLVANGAGALSLDRRLTR